MTLPLASRKLRFYQSLYFILGVLYALYNWLVSTAIELPVAFVYASFAVALSMFGAGVYALTLRTVEYYFRASSSILAFVVGLHFLAFYYLSGFNSLFIPGYFIIYFYTVFVFWRIWQIVLFSIVYFLFFLIGSFLLLGTGTDVLLNVLFHGFGIGSIGFAFAFQVMYRRKSKDGFLALNSFIQYSEDAVFLMDAVSCEIIKTNVHAEQLLSSPHSEAVRKELIVQAKASDERLKRVPDTARQSNTVRFNGDTFEVHYHFFRSAYRSAVALVLRDVTREQSLKSALKTSEISQAFHDYLHHRMPHFSGVEDFIQVAFGFWSGSMPFLAFVPIARHAEGYSIFAVEGAQFPVHWMRDITFPDPHPESVSHFSKGRKPHVDVWLDQHLMQEALWLPVQLPGSDFVGVLLVVPSTAGEVRVNVDRCHALFTRMVLLLSQMQSRKLEEGARALKQNLLTGLPDLILMVNMRGEIQEIFGTRPDTWPALASQNSPRSLQDLLPMPLVLQTEEALQRAQSYKSIQQLNYRLNIADDTHHYEVRVCPMGEGLAALVLRNQTERVRVEGLLASERHVLSLLQENADIELSIFHMLKGLDAVAGDFYASFLVLAPDGRTIQRAFSPRIPVAYCHALAGLTIGPFEGSCGAAIFLKKRIITADIHTDAKWVKYRELADAYGLRACISQPIIGHDGKVYGTLALYRKQVYQPTEQVLAFVDRAAQFMALLFALKETRSAVAKSEQLYRSIVQLNTDMIIRYDREFTIQLVNDALCSFFGTSSNDLIGRSMLELMPEEERDSMQQNLLDVLLKNTDHKEVRRTELAPDQVRYVEWVSMPINDAHGQIEGIQAVGRDVTALKLAEERVQRNEHLLKSINANVQDGIYRSEVLTGRIVYANKAFLQMFGYDSVQSIPGQSTKALYANVMERESMTEHAEAGQLFDNEERLLLKSNGTTFWGMFSCVVSATPEGMLLYDGVIKDTTELRKAEQKIRQQNAALKKLNAELDRFVYSVSHNLRSPLASLLGLINIVKAEPHETAQLLPMMESSIHKLDDFIKDLIDYSKNARVQLQPQPITIHALCSEIVDSLRFMEGAARVEVQLEMAERLTCMSDLSRLKLILENLITNSFKYHNPHIAHPRIRISAEEENGTLRLSVEDNGLGIDDAHHAHIFQMFYRANDKVQGSGLGLFIVKEAVDRLGGSISLTSQVNKGSCFTLLLPSLSAEAVAQPVTQSTGWKNT